jgi:hypothetical protein
VEQPSSEQPKSTLRRPSRTPWVIAVLLLAVAAGVGVWWLRSQQAAPPPPAPPVAQATSPDAGPGAGPVAEEPARPMDQRSLVEAMSPNALFRRWAAQGDLIRRWVVVTDNLAEGVSPRAELSQLAPARPFSVLQGRGGEAVIAPAAYHRYDDVGDVVSSIDAAAAARCYRGLHGALQAAYRALGYPGADLDAVTARALRRLIAAPVRDAEIAVRKEEGVYVFVDDRLEELGAVEKHLLRMGPRNERIVQAKARELLAALGLEAGSGTRR